MNFLEHKQGPGSIVYAADAAILLTASEIMNSYLQEIREQTKVALECAEAGATDTIQSGEAQKQQAYMSGGFQIAGGITGLAVGLGCLTKSIQTTKELKPVNEGRTSISETLESLEKTPDQQKVSISEGKITLNGKGKQIQIESKDVVKQIEETDFEKQTLKITREETSTNAREPLSKAEQEELLANLNERDKQQLKTFLKQKQETLNLKSQKLEADINRFNNLINMTQPVNGLLSGIGEMAKAEYVTQQAANEAAKLLANQAGEFVKQTDQINTQGAQNAFEQMQRAHEMFHAVVSANTRA